jgi:Winged helix-turn helix
MRGRRSALVVVLTEAERAFLKRLVRSTKAPASKVARARMVLKFADGGTFSGIARQMEVERVLVRKWVKRFVRKRIEGLDDLKRTGRPPAFPPGGRGARRQDRVRTT